MKTTLSRAAALAAAIAIGGNAAAQGVTTLGVEVRLTSPAGELGDWHQTGIGAAANAEYDLSVNWRATGQVGYARFSGKSIRGIPDAAPELRVLGASAGLRSFIGTSAMHLGLEFGAYSYRSSRTHFSNEGLRRDFGLLPSIGYRTGTFDTTVQYKLGGDAQWVEVRATMQLLRF